MNVPTCLLKSDVLLNKNNSSGQLNQVSLGEQIL